MDVDYACYTGQPRRYERVFWWPTHEWVEYTVEVSLGRQDGVLAAPDAAMEPERMPGDSARQEAARKASETLRHATELAILACLRACGPSTRAEIAERTGKVPDTVTEALRRRPDLFESNEKHYNRLWWAKER